MVYDYKVKVNGGEEEVHSTELGCFCQFEMDSPVKVEIFCSQAINKVDIRPKSRNISTECSEGKIELNLPSPAKLSIEINEDVENPLFLFADSPENSRPDPEDPNVKYFKSGQRYETGEIELTDNQTLYIERGAIIEGCVVARNSKNIKIAGRGVMDASKYQNATQILGCENVIISGITIVKSGIEWVNRIFNCTNVHISDYKGISRGRYSDGLDLLGCKHVVVDNVFIRSWDDSIVIKSNKFGYSGNVEDILIQNCVLWNGLAGNALEIGYETDTEYIRDITFRNIDIIRSDRPKDSWWRCAALSIHHAGNAKISHIRFEDIRIEATMESLVYFGIVTTTPEWGNGGGVLSDVYVKDIQLTGGPAAPSFIKGLDTSELKGIIFDNLMYHGRKINNEQDAKAVGFTIEYAEVSWK